MADRGAITKLWAEALSERTDERMTALAEAMADDIVTVSALGTTEGKEAVLASFGQSPIAAFFAQGKWSEPKDDGDGWTIACRFPPAAPIGGVRVHLTFDASDRITRAESTVEQAPTGSHRAETDRLHEGGRQRRAHGCDAGRRGLCRWRGAPAPVVAGKYAGLLRRPTGDLGSQP